MDWTPPTHRVMNLVQVRHRSRRKRSWHFSDRRLRNVNMSIVLSLFVKPFHLLATRGLNRAGARGEVMKKRDLLWRTTPTAYQSCGFFLAKRSCYLLLLAMMLLDASPGPIPTQYARREGEHLVPIGWHPVEQDFFDYPKDRTPEIQKLVAQHLSLRPHQRCTVASQAQWLYGSFTFCIPTTLTNWREHRVLFRCPLPHRLTMSLMVTRLEEILQIGPQKFKYHRLEVIMVAMLVHSRSPALSNHAGHPEDTM